MPSGLAAVPQAQLPSKYRDVVKIALRPRQTRAFILAAVAWHLLLTSALLRTVSLSLISPLTLAVSLLSFGLGVLPLLARRKRKLAQITTPPARLASSTARQFATALSNPGFLSSALQHIVSFVVLSLGYSVLLTSKSGGWGPQVWVDSHGSFYLNERFLYLIGQSIVLGIFYTLFFRSLPSPETAASPFFDTSALTSDRALTIKDRVAAACASRVPKAAAAAALASTSSILVYSVIRIRLWSAVLLVLGTRSLLRRLLVPSFRVDFSFFEVSVRTTLFSIAAVCAVETAHLLLDVYLTHPLPPVSKYAKNQIRLLLDGLDEPILFFSNHAFSEVARLSASDEESRSQIYRNVNADVTAWTHVRDRCLGLLDAQKQFVVRRGQMPPAVQTKAPPAAQQQTQQQLQQQNSSTQSAPSIWDQLAAGNTTGKEGSASAQSSAATATTTAGSAVNSKASANTSSVLSLQSIQKAVLSIAAIGWKFVPEDAKHVLFGPRRRQMLLGDSPASEAASIVGRDAARTVAATQTLKNLLCHSLTEDPYGSVQKDIKRILVAMVDLDSEIRRLGLELEQRAISIDEQLNKVEAAASSSTATEGSKSKKEAPQQQTGGRNDCQQQLREAWRSSGAQSVDGSLTASIREILDTFAKFDLQLGNELEVKLADCLS
ncbi:Nucleoporin protein Ndc1-Nup [Kalmanozyma brasiliensis GHG001]|uniref:Nucleoporin protein Ndc1-Nup n=1 Tax=Kalmanozyma brasiliensis (strain GHG001) TaxID=1365824 RepID=V5EUU9_KALBG|nr:Nucleoporin protein Ndc1-Nup [Kalmanozyma brasiliensis GHG001]EST06963.1 Nucleoporin protein Ndc1-Nup [Kalmanozyma brasiliensis GHG001]